MDLGSGGFDMAVRLELRLGSFSRGKVIGLLGDDDLEYEIASSRASYDPRRHPSLNDILIGDTVHE